ncbi:uncharacterized protein [Typha latifolia]|uniref:uncharacterized protein n=1 Tax=Typha latifolia TaxID=4733 RepID=UPI003C30253C
MAVQFTGTCLHWSQLCPTATITAHALSSSCQATFFANSVNISSLSSERSGSDPALNHRSPFLGDKSELWRTRWPSEFPRGRRRKDMELRASNSNEEDEAFIRKLQELDLKLKLQQGAESSGPGGVSHPSPPSPLSRKAEQPLPETADFPLSVERKASSVDIPLSLRIIKRKKMKKQEVQWDEFRDAGESACCSVKKAFSSMVFIIRELQSFALRMRGDLVDDDLHLQGVVARVQHEMHASFVWLFQHIFSCTPTLMVSLMLLLANFSVYSAAVASPNPPTRPRLPTVAASAAVEHRQARFDQSSIKTFSIGGGGGGKIRPVAGATDDGRPDGSSSSYGSRRCTILPDGIRPDKGGVRDGTLELTMEEEVAMIWNRIVEEASRMQSTTRDEMLMDPETLMQLVAPVRVELEADHCSDYLRTELMYQQAVSQEPHNSLFLSNFAEFLYLVLHDHDRAESYFKRAVRVEPVDAESLSRYARFLWLAKGDLRSAEETFLEAMAVEPDNTIHAANYANFLWSTAADNTGSFRDTSNVNDDS